MTTGKRKYALKRWKKLISDTNMNNVGRIYNDAAKKYYSPQNPNKRIDIVLLKQSNDDINKYLGTLLSEFRGEPNKLDKINRKLLLELIGLHPTKNICAQLPVRDVTVSSSGRLKKKINNSYLKLLNDYHFNNTSTNVALSNVSKNRKKVNKKIIKENIRKKKEL